MHRVRVKTMSLLCLGVFLQVQCASSGPGSLDEPATRPNAGEAEVWNFDRETTGSLPSRWVAAETHGRGKPGNWRITADDNAVSGPNVLKLDTTNRGRTYNLCVLQATQYADLNLSVVLRADSGEEDRGGGLVWRYRDPDNYYIVRVNPLESNFRLYKVVGGKRKQMHSADANVPTGRWATVRIEHVADRIDCYLDGKRLISATDETFPGAGLVGLWTKADASTSFDDLTITSNPAK